MIFCCGIPFPKAKSFVVASALLDKTLTAEEAIRLAQLEEDFQIERFLEANVILKIEGLSKVLWRPFCNGDFCRILGTCGES